MRAAVIIPVLIVLSVAGGYAIAVAMSVTPPLREMIAAAVVCLIASELALVPLMRTRGATQASVVQAALLGTIIHLFGCCGLGGALIITKPFGIGLAFTFWLLGLYCLTLIVVVIALIGAVKSAPIAAAK
jgi:hypothetical protein